MSVLSRRALGARFAAVAAVGMASPALANTGAQASGIPPYRPGQPVVGPVRCYGFALGGVLEKWQAAFKAIHPGVTFQNTLPTSDAAFPALVTGQTDLAPNGGEPAITEWLSFYETHGYHATDIVVATGSFDTPSRSNGPVILVHESNPLSEITIDQLDGVFGAERMGSMNGFVWSPSGARGADKDIRTWGQLGLTGAWADRPIQTYGHASSGTTRFFQLHVLGNTDKWNPNYRAYVETGSKMIDPADTDSRLGIQSMLRNELSKDPTGIGWTIMSQARDIPGLKLLAVAPRGSTRAVMPSQASFQQRTYPLARQIYIYLDRAPGAPAPPALKEFLRFALSREGQAMVSEGGYLPLTPENAAIQSARLD